MSEETPNSPSSPEEPASTSEPSTRDREQTPRAVNSGPSQNMAHRSPASLDFSAKILDIAKQSWAKAQPVLQKNTIKALLVANKGSEHFLDNILPPLTQKTIAAIPADAKTKFNTQKEKIQPTLNKLQPIWQKVVLPFWSNVVVPNWGKLLNFLRQRLPAELKNTLTNRFLTIGIAVVLWFVLWLWGAITPDRSVAQQKPVRQPTVATRPASSPKPTYSTPRTAPSIAPKAPSAAVKVAPKEPVAVAPPPPSPSPVPIAPPKPEIDLVAIQTQLESAIERQGDGLVKSVQAPEKFQQLQINLSGDWYGLGKDEQDQLTQTLAQQSEKLKFSKFELRDDQSALVARSPIVGNEVVILKRSS
jgi:hypothetical protein